MKKIKLIVITLSLIAKGYSLADNQIFQSMDNQIGIGYGYSQTTAYNTNNNYLQQTTTNSSININVEQLFNNDVWLSLNGSFIFLATQSKTENKLDFIDNIQSFGMPANITGKIGYSFNSARLGLQIIPYITSGMVLNYNGVTIPNNGFANSYYMLYGGGIRAEYVVAPQFSVFFDQMVGYLNDNGLSKPNLSAMNYSSTLGLKFNAMKHLQFGLQGNISAINTISQDVGYNDVTLFYRNSNQNSYGGLFSVAYLFDDTNDDSSHNYLNQTLAGLDNSYSIGYGFTNSTNSYQDGSLKNIDSNLTFLNLQFTHLFDNNIWAKIDGNLITGITQTNALPGNVSKQTPTYLGFPGAATANLGYAFAIAQTNAQIIPYLNGGVVANINSYNIRENLNLSYILSHDYFLQYGIGGRAEYAINKYWEVYYDQLFAALKDNSVMGLNAWRSTSTLGTKVNVYQNIQLGVNAFYDSINPMSIVYNPANGVNYAANQNSYGGLFTLGVSY